jgi:CheY-like chemotaxis protein
VQLLEGDPVSLIPGRILLGGDGSPGVYQSGKIHSAPSTSHSLQEFFASLETTASHTSLLWLPGMDRLDSEVGIQVEALMTKGLRAYRLFSHDAQGSHSRALPSNPWASWQLSWPLFAIEGLWTQLPEDAYSVPGRWLIAEDEESQRMFLLDCCRREGLICDAVGDGLEALRLLSKSEYSGIVLDGNMPEVDGWKTLSWILKEKPAMKVLFVSGEDGAEKKIASGGAEFLPKPFTSEELRAAIRRLVKLPLQNN